MFACLDVHLRVRFFLLLSTRLLCVHCKFPRCGTIKAQLYLVLLHNQVKRKKQQRKRKCKKKPNKKKTFSAKEREENVVNAWEGKALETAPSVPVSRINRIYTHMHVNKALVGKVQFRCIHGRRRNSLLRNSAEAVTRCPAAQTPSTRHMPVCQRPARCAYIKERMFQKKKKITQVSLSDQQNRRRACAQPRVRRSAMRKAFLTCSSAASAGSFPESAAQRRYTHTLRYQTHTIWHTHTHTQETGPGVFPAKRRRV